MLNLNNKWTQILKFSILYYSITYKSDLYQLSNFNGVFFKPRK